MRYSVLNGGKRIRPILAIAAFDVVGGYGDSIFPFACALEMIHSYSLVHDDLPAMDDDDFRRGRPTTHRVFGEAVAILAGDALLTEAFRMISRGVLEYRVDPTLAIEIIQEIAWSAGYSGMVGGQVVDMESQGKGVDLPTVEYIHTHKTGALIVASLRTGAKLGKCSPEQLDAISRYGERIGLVFQVIDDILDVVGDRSVLGKDVGSDGEKEKATYPAVLGIVESRRLAASLAEAGIDSLQMFRDKAEPLREIARFIVERAS